MALGALGITAAFDRDVGAGIAEDRMVLPAAGVNGHIFQCGLGVIGVDAAVQRHILDCHAGGKDRAVSKEQAVIRSTGDASVLNGDVLALEDRLHIWDGQGLAVQVQHRVRRKIVLGVLGCRYSIIMQQLDRIALRCSVHSGEEGPIRRERPVGGIQQDRHAVCKGPRRRLLQRAAGDLLAGGVKDHVGAHRGGLRRRSPGVIAGTHLGGDDHPVRGSGGALHGAIQDPGHAIGLVAQVRAGNEAGVADVVGGRDAGVGNGAALDGVLIMGDAADAAHPVGAGNVQPADDAVGDGQIALGSVSPDAADIAPLVVGPDVRAIIAGHGAAADSGHIAVSADAARPPPGVNFDLTADMAVGDLLTSVSVPHDGAHIQAALDVHVFHVQVFDYGGGIGQPKESDIAVGHRIVESLLNIEVGNGVTTAVEGPPEGLALRPDGLPLLVLQVDVSGQHDVHSLVRFAVVDAVPEGLQLFQGGDLIGVLPGAGAAGEHAGAAVLRARPALRVGTGLLRNLQRGGGLIVPLRRQGAGGQQAQRQGQSQKGGQDLVSQLVQLLITVWERGGRAACRLPRHGPKKKPKRRGRGTPPLEG